MSKLLLVPGVCLLLIASCKSGSTDCSTEEQRLRQELSERDERIRNLEDSLHMMSGGSMQPASGSNVSNGERSLYREGAPRMNRANARQSQYPGQFPEGSERTLTERDVEFLSQWGRTMMLTEIYARHGMRFSDVDVQGHYDRQDWYKGRSNNVDSKLSKVERANVAFIKNYESSLKAQ